MRQVNEENLIKLFRQTGDPDLFGRLIAPYDLQMRSVAMSILRHEADAMDVAQDAAIRAFQNIDSLADPSRFGGWLMRIVFGCSIDWMRSCGSGVNKNREVLLEEPVGHTPRPSDRLDAQEWSTRISEEINSLPTHYRQPLYLFHLDGLSTAQVARHLNIPQGTVRSLLTRARRKLSEQLPTDLKEVPILTNEIFGEQAVEHGLLSQSGRSNRLHVMNGDAAAERLRSSGLDDPIIVWSDILHEGPTPIGTSPIDWRSARAEHLSSMGFGKPEVIKDRMAQADSVLADPGDGCERVLWFEHDLYDQLLLIRHLHWLSQHETEVRNSISLICIGDFPGIDRFIGLGQLEPDQIVSLLDTRQPITEEHIDLGREVWADFCHSDPNYIAKWLSVDTPALPYLQRAIRRHLQQYPSVSNGLGLTEQYILDSLHRKSQQAGAVFAGHQSREESPFMGDGVFYDYIARLASETNPALTIRTQQSVVTAQTEVAITDFGRHLLAGEADRVQCNGIDRWFGGVWLVGQGPLWRWDDQKQSFVFR